MSITHVTPREMELRAEVTRLNAALAHWKESWQSAIDAGELMKAESERLYLDAVADKKVIDKLRAKLTALEAQPAPLYLAAGAKP